jgi:hypothetical protein
VRTLLHFWLHVAVFAMVVVTVPFALLLAKALHALLGRPGGRPADIDASRDRAMLVNPMSSPLTNAPLRDIGERNDALRVRSERLRVRSYALRQVGGELRHKWRTIARPERAEAGTPRPGCA